MKQHKLPKLSVYYSEEVHPDFLFDYGFDREKEDADMLKRIKEFIDYKYNEGKTLRRENYFEIVIRIKNHHLYRNFDEALNIEAVGFTNEKIYYSVGQVSDDFITFLKETIHWDNFYPDYYTSIKIFNGNSVLNLEDKEADKTYREITNSIIFELHHKYNLQIELIDLSDYEKYDSWYFEEQQLEPIESTTIEPNQYDQDLLSYYNRALIMETSEFKYLAYFQVIECLFDEVYRYETIQDVRGILKSNWFSLNKNENIDSLINVVERYNKDKNDRNKTKLVLEKYFKGELHDEAYFLVNKEIINLLSEMSLISKKDDLKDLQKIGNIVYDFRCNCTHSNRSFPVKNSTVISNDQLDKYIDVIRKMAERVILTYVS